MQPPSLEIEMKKDIQENLRAVLSNCRKIEKTSGREANACQLICVSKTFEGEIVKYVLDAGHRVFGENRVQEAQGKWPDLKKEFDGVELHLIGPLQSNKTSEAVALFDVIQTVDREKIAMTLAKEMAKQQKFPKLLVQVNTGSEPQKAGIEPEDTADFVKRCQDIHGLEISGLMCIPPNGENPGPHFALLRKLAEQLNLAWLSIGMSGDYETAIEMGATHVRVGSAIFGRRDYSV